MIRRQTVPTPILGQAQAIVTYRRFVWATAVADFRHRYAGSGIGTFWNVLIPLATLLTYTAVFVLIYRGTGSTSLPSRGALALYVSAGILPWTMFADGVSRSARTLVASASYLRRMSVPEQVFVAATALSATFSMLIVVAMVAVLALAFGHPPRLVWLLIPVVALLWQAFGFGLGLVLSTFNVFFRDVGEAAGIVLHLWMWSLPIVYPESLLPASYLPWLRLNPAYPFLTVLRTLFIEGEMTGPGPWVAMLFWVVLANLAGFWVLTRLRHEIRDQL